MPPYSVKGEIFMKAISCKPWWANKFFDGSKTIECRTWKTDYRGDVLICSSGNGKIPGLICNRALVVANLVDIVPFTEEHLAAAGMVDMPEGNCYAWIFDNFADILPFTVKGKLHMFDVDDDLIKYVDFDDDDDAGKYLDNIIAPMTYRYQPAKGFKPDEKYINDFFTAFNCGKEIWA
jgi:hypothetical protein